MTFKFARRMNKIEVSGIRRMFDLAQELDEPIDCSLGQPHFDVPEEIKRAASDAIRDGQNRYTATQGIQELRDAVFEYFERKYGYRRKSTDACIVTTGATGGLFLSCAVLLDEGDEVLIPDPYFVLYCHLVNFTGATPVIVDTYATKFKVTPELLRRCATPKTKALIFNNPVNPTGAAYTKDELKQIEKFARENGIIILSDEVYNHFMYDFPHETMLNHNDGAIVIGALSKTYGMPGWRIGYAIGPREVIDKMITLQQFCTVCAPAPLQRAAVKALSIDMESRIAAEYRKKRDLAYEMLRERFEIVKPQGAFYIYPKVPWGDDESFVKAALESKVVLCPSRTCSQRKTHFRLSYAVSDDTLECGLEILNKLAKR